MSIIEKILVIWMVLITFEVKMLVNTVNNLQKAKTAVTVSTAPSTHGK
jgi:hypothetical protein